MQFFESRMSDARVTPPRCDTLAANPCPASWVCSTTCNERRRPLWPGESWRPHWCVSSLFLGFRQLQCHFAHQHQQLLMLVLEADDLRECGLSFHPLRYPSVYGGFGDAVVLCCLHDRDAVVLDAVDNLLLHFGSGAMLFHIATILTNNYKIGV